MVQCYNTLPGSCPCIYKVVSQFVPLHHIPAVVAVVVLYMPYRLASMPTNNQTVRPQACVHYYSKGHEAL